MKSVPGKSFARMPPHPDRMMPRWWVFARASRTILVVSSGLLVTHTAKTHIDWRGSSLEKFNQRLGSCPMFTGSRNQ